MTSKLHFKIWAPFVLAIAAIACGGPSTSSNGGGDPGVPDKPADVTVAETAVDFGFGGCGRAAPPQKAIKIENRGGGAVAWTAEIELPGFSVVGATSGTFNGGGSVNVIVRPLPMAASATAGTEIRATLVVVIDKQKLFRVPLRVVAQGATLVVTPNEVAFGELPLNTQAADLPVSIKNTGNSDASVRFGAPAIADFDIRLTGMASELKVAAGATATGIAARFRPTTRTQQATTAPMTVSGAVCGASANAVPLSGKGTGGVVGIGPGQLDFGKVNCGTTKGFQIVTILNDGNAAFDWTAALGAGTNFDISPSAGTILAKSQAQLFVTPRMIPAVSAVTNNLYGDTLTVTTNAPADLPHDIPLLMTAQGAILSFATLPGDFGTRGLFGAATPKTVGVTNTGNANATVKLTSSSAAYVAPAVFSVVAASTTSTSVSFTPVVFGDNSGDLTMSTNDVICQPLPSSTPMTGAGKGVATNVAVGFERSNGESGSTCAVITGGHVACWGDNRFGQLGNGNTTSQTTPVVVPNFANAVQVASGGSHNCARTTAGTVYCWGANTSPNQGTVGQLGSAGGNKSVPTLVAGVANVISIAADHHHTCAVAAAAAGGTSGKIMCWGTNRRGQLGTGTNGTVSLTPVQAGTITDAVQVSVAAVGGCARRATNAVVCWGQNTYHGNIGDGTASNNPGGGVVTATPTNVLQVAAASNRGGTGLGCVAQVGGGVTCWGDNKAPQRFGGGATGKISGPSSNALPPTVIVGVAGATAVAAARRHMCALVAGGTGVCWGVGINGELGNGANPIVSTPVAVSGLTGAVQISAAGSSTCAVLNTGAISCWGSNDSGQLGNPAAAGNVPTIVSGF